MLEAASLSFPSVASSATDWSVRHLSHLLCHRDRLALGSLLLPGEEEEEEKGEEEEEEEYLGKSSVWVLLSSRSRLALSTTTSPLPIPAMAILL